MRAALAIGAAVLAGVVPARADSLAGRWRYALDADVEAARVPASAARMAVPSNWYAQGLDRSGAVWFARTVDVPEGGAHRLEFGGIDYRCDVYWDGARIGGHTGYFAPFAVAVPAGSGRHELTIRVDSPSESAAAWSLHKTLIKGVLSHHDTRPGGAWSPDGQDANTGGIWGAVRLAEARTAWLDDVRVTTRAATAASAQLELTATVAPLRAGDAAVHWRVLAPDGRIAASGVWTGRGALAVPIAVAAPARWWPRGFGAAALYRVELDVGDDHAATRFGIRTVAQDGAGRIVVNGAPIFLRGTNYIGSLYLASLDRRTVQRDLELMIAANINAVRVHAHVTSPAFYDVADELGLLVWQDFPLQWGYDDSESFAREAAAQLRDMLALLGGHPSVIHWTAQNEAPWSSDWMQWKYPDYDPDQNRRLSAALGAVLATDPTRPSQVNSGTAEHAWSGWYSGTLHDFDKPQTQPILTEFGAQALPARATLATFLRADQLWPLDDANLPAWEYHGFQKHELVDIAKVPLAATLDGEIAATQAYQARLYQCAIEALRRQAWQPIAGVFQFMFVEHWASTSWGAVDYLRHPKPGYAALARAYQPVLAMVAPRGTGRLVLAVANDTPRRLAATVIAVRLRGRAAVSRRRISVELPATGIARVAEPLAAPLAGETLLLTVVDAAGATISENRYDPGYFAD